MNLHESIGLGFLKLLQESQLSRRKNITFRDFYNTSRVNRLQLSTSKELLSSSGAVINVLSLDRIDYRYVLAGGINGLVSLYDLESYSGSGHMKPVCTTNGNTRGFSSITSVQWYPEDCGLFTSTNLGGELLVYDTNQFCIANQFLFPDEMIYAAKMKSASGTSGPLVAVGLKNGLIHLCDLVSGDSSHILQGHNRAVTSVDWSPIHSFQLCSSSADGTIRVWDIRKGGTEAGLLWLDWRQDHTARASIDMKRLTSTRDPTPTVHNGVTIVQDSTSSKAYRHLSTNTSVSSSGGGGGAALAVGKAHDQAVMGMRYSPDGNYILSAGNDQRLRLWSAHTGRLQAVHYDVPVSGNRQMPFQMEVMQVTSRAIDDVIVLPDQSSSSSSGGSGGSSSSSSSSSSNIVTSGDLLLVPMHSADGKATGRLKGHLGPVNAAVYRRPCQQLVTAGKDGLILLWEAPTHSGVIGDGDELVDEDSWSVDDTSDDVAQCGAAFAGTTVTSASVAPSSSSSNSSSGSGGVGRRGLIMQEINQSSTSHIKSTISDRPVIASNTLRKSSNSSERGNTASVSSSSSSASASAGEGINWSVIDRIMEGVDEDHKTAGVTDDLDDDLTQYVRGAIATSSGGSNSGANSGNKKKAPDRRAGIFKQLNKRKKMA